VLFGGRALFPSDETWEHDGTGWQPVVTSPRPPARYGNGLVFDTRRKRAVLFGGTNGNSLLGDTWEYYGLVWSQAVPATAPPVRYLMAMAYDSVRARVVLFGGQASGSNSYLGDTWEYDGANWTGVAVAAPVARADAGFAFDSVRARCVLFGGTTAGTPAFRNDTWEYDGVGWTPVTPPLAPSARVAPAMTFDADRGIVVLFGGGSQGTSSTSLNDSWQFDGITWAQISPAGALPPPRREPGIAYDSLRRSVVVFGGVDSQILGDLWELGPPTVATWARVGRGCAGPAGTPSLDRVGNARPVLGSTFAVQLSALPPQPGLCYVMCGFDVARWDGVAFGFPFPQWSPAALPVGLAPIGMPGCDLWIDALAGFGFALVHPGGSAGFTIAIPANPALRGVLLAMQALVFDPPAVNGIGTLSNAGAAAID
jgi:hypothetical protein